MDISDEIRKLSELKDNGLLSEEEYQKAKENLLNSYRPLGHGLSSGLSKFAGDVNMWCLMIHLSQFCGYVVPFLGMIVPIVLWQVKKNEDPLIDQHGRIVVNWIITEVILAVVFALLSVVLIGYPLLIALVIVGIVFPIVGGIKASQREVWPYPGSLKFF